MLKASYTTSDLCGLCGKHRSTIIRRAQRESWQSSSEVQMGALASWLVASMPPQTQEEILAKVAPVPAQITEARIPEPREELADWQRDIRDARLVILDHVRGLAKSVGGIMKAEKQFAKLAKDKNLPSDIMILCETANARKRKNGPPVTAKSLRNWRTLYKREGVDALAPKPTGKDKPAPLWLKDFLLEYCKPGKPSVASTHEDMIDDGYQGLPSVRAVQLTVNKLPKLVTMKGRHGPRELRNMKAFTRREFSDLLPTDVYTSDGHCMDIEVANPRGGRPFRPEMITVVDVATRAVVGWSTGHAEGALLVADSLRHAVEECGIPAIYYVDNGCGFKNNFLDNAVTGLMSRLGITKKHSLPYGSRARGVIEGLNKTLWIRKARHSSNYVGRDMDKEIRQQIYKRAKNEVAMFGGVTSTHMSWDQYMDWCAEQVQRYNNRPHSSLPRIVDPSDGTRRHMTPAERWQMYVEEGFEPIRPTSVEVEEMFRPRVERTTKGGWVPLHNKQYFARELELYTDTRVQVAYDIHDPEYTWIYDLKGRLIVKAKLNGNTTSYFSKSVVDEARERRAKGQLKRIEAKKEAVFAELHGDSHVIEPVISEEQAALQDALIAEQQPEPDQGVVIDINTHRTAIPDNRDDRYEMAVELQDQLASGQSIDETLHEWLVTYIQTNEYKAQDQLASLFSNAAVK